LSGATTNSYSVSNAQTNNSGDYRAIVTNSFGAVTSAVATVTVIPFAPTITVQPVSQTVPVNGDIAMTVSALGAAPLSYQWRFNSSPILGGVGPAYSISGVQPEDAGSYDVIVANSYGSVRSSKAVLKVFTPALIGQPLIASNNFILSFPSQTGFTYTVQYSSNLGTTLWNNLLSTNGTGVSITVKDPLAAQAGRFYRIIIQ
jgi:hypothetical protein